VQFEWPSDDELEASLLLDSDEEATANDPDAWLYRSPAAVKSPLSSRDWLGGELARDELAAVMQKLNFSMADNDYAENPPLNRSWASADVRLNHSFDGRRAAAAVARPASAGVPLPSFPPARGCGVSVTPWHWGR
jgi:hypothetical protein